MSIETVRDYFASLGRGGQVREFGVSSATVELAAAALGVEGARIAKTLSLVTPEGCVLIVAAGDARIDNRKFKDFFHCKAVMAPRDECEALTGHAVGGVCPFCNPPGVQKFLDESLRRFETVFPACGSANSAIELSCGELAQLTGAAWVDVCRGWRAEQ